MTPLDHALALAARGFAVFPCHTMTPTGCSCGKPACDSPGKHPATKDGFKSASREPDAIRAMWAAAPSNANIGIAAGAASGGLQVVDADGPEGLASVAGFPATLSARTGSGGLHLYYRLAEGSQRNTTRRIALGVDSRGDGGYVIAPPSLHASGGAYAWVDPDAPIADLPADILAAMRRRGPRTTGATTAPVEAPVIERPDAKSPVTESGRAEKPMQGGSSTPSGAAADAEQQRRRRYALASLDGACDDLRREPKGARHGVALAKARKIGGFVGSGLLTAAEAERALFSATVSGGWDKEREANTLKAIRDGLGYGEAAPLDAPAPAQRRAIPLGSAAASDEEREAIRAEPASTHTPSTAALLASLPIVIPAAPGDIVLDAGTSPTSDIANAARLAAWYGDDLRYCDALGGWFAWDGSRWAQDNAAAWRRAEDTARRLMQTARDKDERKHAERTQNVGGIDAMLRAARNRVGIITPPSAFDADAYVLNVANGLLDLRTGELRPHDRSALCRMITPTRWEGRNYSHPILDQFLAFACELHDGLLPFVARMLGLALIGANPFEAFFVVHGPPGSGKSTLLDASISMLGDYAATAAVETFLANDARRASGAEATPDLARLVGTRLVVCSETKRKSKLDEALIKRVTSDKIVARMLHKDPFEYVPGFKVCLGTNYAPAVDPSETAIWRRLHMLPMDRPVPMEARDPAVKAAMTNVAIVGPALLALAMRGCLDLLAPNERGIARGLMPPACVREATDAYRAAQDPLREFLEDRCILFADENTDLLPTDPSLRLELFRKHNSYAPLATLRTAYEAWCKEQGQQLTLGPKAFGAALDAHGCVVTSEYSRSANGSIRIWHGVRLRSASSASVTAIRS